MIRLSEKKIGDYHVITSPDVPGLYVADLDLAKARSLVDSSVAALERMADRRQAEDTVRDQLDRVA